MAENNELEQKLQAGIAAAKSGDRASARALLEEVIAQDDNNEMAWIWLASAVTTLSERRACLEKVLRINPNNQRAREALAKLGGKQAMPAPEPGEYDQLRQLQQARQPQQAPQQFRLEVEPPVVARRRSNAGLLVVVALVVIAVVGAGLVGTSLLAPATPTPTRVLIVATQGPTNTPRPTHTPFVVALEDREVATLPPTFTPTATETPSPTFTPSPTLIPEAEYAIIYTARQAFDPNPTLYRINGDGGLESILGNDVSDATYDVNGDLVAFVRTVSYEADEEVNEPTTVKEIFVGRADDLANAQQVTRLRIKNAYSPTFSPDARQIVFVSDWDGDEDLWLLDINTGIVSQLTRNTANDRDPDWSPDGTTVAYSSDIDSPGLNEIYALVFTVTEEGGEPVITRLTDIAGSNDAPKWSPDGSRIAYISDRDGDGDVYVMDADGDRSFQLTQADQQAEDRVVDWTPDGRFIAFVSNREDERFQIYWVDLQARNVFKLPIGDVGDVESISFRPELRYRLQFLTE